MESLSIMLPNYNKAPYIEECFRSILKQTCDRWTAVCMDDGSTDGSRAILERYARNPKFIVKFKAHEGIAATMRQIIELAPTDIVFGLGTDDFLLPDAVEKILGFYEAHSDAGFVYTNYWQWKEGSPYRLGYSKPIPAGQTNLDLVKGVIGPLRTFRRKFYHMTEGYDARLPAAIDMDIIYKLEEVTKPMLLDEPLAVHRVIRNSVSHGEGQKIAKMAHRKAQANARARRIVCKPS
jgi:glycosyltransferase involved in cell wall biosynthesis